ncbi:MAG: 30S ribosomal protein S1 [Candidatus Harrisonbacteria bacterium CG10_big_fil_rev_8_21_14_0_10_38_8]|uniref:30S ribosomal protein S1 n=1 Tax=Candidatus Harrisonbacteria bacterium CG10_big_fil_rev_8_21_14_0_10_38_8 TaxID=1974582 RepID=A0A2M6WK72_9BACT|nr:MAG: 30S ribosomal protein S1 [Candidatus Harrisonbacteria bacterium CG10_big_fil_rev_8_21_14_0_10_38_8]
MITKKRDSAFAQLLKKDTEILKPLKLVEFIEGKLIKKGQKIAYFDLGNLGTGILYGAEFVNSGSAVRKLNIGDAVSVKVVEVENEDGFVEVSLSQAGQQETWNEIKEIRDNDDIINVKITGANSGGLLTDVSGIKAFLPVSQLANVHYPRVPDGNKEGILDELKKLIGETLRVKIISNNQSMNKLIVSEKEIADESVKEILGQFNVGDVIDGVISGVADFGAFFQFEKQPTIEGLIHISEIDHRLIESPKEILKVGDKVQAKIVEIKNGRVNLSIKALKPNPWETIGDKYKEGQIVEGTVTRFNPFGAFIGLDREIQGLIHVTEFGSVEEMKAQLVIDKQYKFKIESMKPMEKRIILKLSK